MAEAAYYPSRRSLPIYFLVLFLYSLVTAELSCSIVCYVCVLRMKRPFSTRRHSIVFVCVFFAMKRFFSAPVDVHPAHSSVRADSSILREIPSSVVTKTTTEYSVLAAGLGVRYHLSVRCLTQTRLITVPSAIRISPRAYLCRLCASTVRSPSDLAVILEYC